MAQEQTPTPSPAVRLAEEALVAAQKLQAALAAEGLPQPSSEANGPTYVVAKSASEDAKHARNVVMDTAFKLFNLVSGPGDLLANMAASYQTMFALHWLLHFNIVSHVPVVGTVSYTELAEKAAVPLPLLKGVARMAMTSSILTEPEPGHVAHTASSLMFTKQPKMNDWAEYMFSAGLPAAAGMVKATEKWPNSVQKNETAYNIAFNHDLSFFDHLSQSPALTTSFSGYMKALSDGQGFDLSHLVNGFDWNRLPDNSLIVDVGGSSGHASLAVAASFPRLHFEVQDLEPVISKQEKPLGANVQFKVHSFFEPQPTLGASVYLLRAIIHDWADAEAVSILQNLVPAMSENSILLIMDIALPEPGTLPATMERVIRTRDMTMHQVFNSKERGLEDWKALLEAASPKLELKDVCKPSGSNMSLLTIQLRKAH